MTEAVARAMQTLNREEQATGSAPAHRPIAATDISPRERLGVAEGAGIRLIKLDLEAPDGAHSADLVSYDPRAVTR